MKFKRYAKMKQGLQAFDLVPYFVDVIIQVLLFYILVSAFTFSPNISVQASQGGHERRRGRKEYGDHDH